MRLFPPSEETVCVLSLTALMFASSFFVRPITWLSTLDLLLSLWGWNKILLWKFVLSAVVFLDSHVSQKLCDCVRRLGTRPVRHMICFVDFKGLTDLTPEHLFFAVEYNYDSTSFNSLCIRMEWRRYYKHARSLIPIGFGRLLIKRRHLVVISVNNRIKYWNGMCYCLTLNFRCFRRVLQSIIHSLYTGVYCGTLHLSVLLVQLKLLSKLIQQVLLCAAFTG